MPACQPGRWRRMPPEVQATTPESLPPRSGSRTPVAVPVGAGKRFPKAPDTVNARTGDQRSQAARAAAAAAPPRGESGGSAATQAGAGRPIPRKRSIPRRTIRR